MSSELLSIIIPDFLFILIVVGWGILIVAGIEPDKPLSGGIPGHVDLSHLETTSWSRVDRIGLALGWLLFGATALSLPLILFWMFTTHGQ
ncbi:MAG: hypothetical protein U0768_18820 [Anaerolineae bacterium]